MEREREREREGGREGESYLHITIFEGDLTYVHLLHLILITEVGDLNLTLHLTLLVLPVTCMRERWTHTTIYSFTPSIPSTTTCT